MDEAEHCLYDSLLERLLGDEGVDDEVAGVVLAAWLGETELAPTAAELRCWHREPTRLVTDLREVTS